MEKEIRFIGGKNLTPEQKEKRTKRTKKILEQSRKEHLKPLEGELEKTPEEIRWVIKINEYLAEEMKSLEIRKRSWISSQQIHLLPEKVFTENFSEKKRSGVFKSLRLMSYVIKDNPADRLRLYKSMLHEAIHAVSRQKYFVKGDTKEKNMMSAGSGYRAANPREEDHEHFRGLNEAITDRLTDEIIIGHRQDLNEKFGISQEEFRHYPLAYAADKKILEAIIKKISEKNEVSEGEVWKKFKKGLFADEKMFLREIEKTFGKGSLRVLAALRSGTKDLPEKETHEKMLRFFQSDDEKEKESLANEILIERERQAYQRRKKEAALPDFL